MSKFFIILILLFAAVLRFWQLGSAELIFDEGLYGFRSIGYLDYLDSVAQPTPVQWLVDKMQLPFWTKLSFHDHPPLFFLVQYLFFNIFGDSLFVARLPSVLVGIAAILVVFLAVREIFLKFFPNGASDFAGLVAAFLLTVNFTHIWISRLSMMESVSILFILLNIYFFIRFLKDQKNWLAFGITLGLCFLTKYTSFFLVPVYLITLLIYQSSLFLNKRLYAAFITAILVFSPVIIYNIYFYKNFGHFDLQFSHLFGQKTPYWQGSSGKTQEPFSNIGTNLLILYSIPFLILTFLGGAFALLWRKIFPDSWSKARSMLFFMVLLAVFITLLLTVTGSAIRFSALYVIPAVFFIALLAAAARQLVRNKSLVLICLGLFLIYEIIFTADLIFVNAPDYGVVKLDQYFDSVFGNGRPAGLLSHPNSHLDKVIKKYALSRPAVLEPSGIVYDDNISTPVRLWVFSRRQFYQGIPIMPASEFNRIINKEGEEFFQGIAIYFVKAEPASPLRQGSFSADAGKIENLLTLAKRSPEAVIKTADGAPAYYVYYSQF